MTKRKSTLHLPANDALLIDVKKVAAMLDVSINTVRRWREMGKLPPAINLHGRVRWRRGDIVAYIDSL